MNISNILKWARLSLGGAALGIATVAMLGVQLGFSDTVTAQSVGAVSGTAVAALLVKLAHLV